MGGTKGQTTTNQSQQQSYAPNPVAAGYINSALQMGQNAANLPFNIPQAPVAGFSQMQQQGFGGINNAQGMAQPYINQAQNYFQQSATPNVSQFFNPLAGAVTSQMNNIFGQQQAQTTGQLTQAAGGVGADRIAVGQANLANQQGLAAGQTLAGLYQPALSAALQEQGQLQGLGQNYANLGTQAQSAALQGAQAQLGAGGLQQQLSQAQMNAPYQQQLAQAQFPYQQANFFGNLVGSLAPGLGGTTTGQSQSVSTPAQPSIWSQILGGGTALAGGLGQSGAFGGNGWLSNAFNSNAQPNYGAIGNSMDTLNNNTGGAFYGPGFADGGDVSDEPINIDASPFIPTGKIAAISPHVPQLNFSQPQQSGGGGGGGGFGDILSAGLKIASMFNRGGAIHPFADGGSIEDRFDPVREAIASGAFDPQGVNSTMFTGSPAMVGSNTGAVPMPLPRPDDAPALAPESAPPPVVPPMQDATAAAPARMPEAAAASPASSETSLASSPWAALTAAGLGIMGGTSPFAGVNIGQGGLKGLQMLQTQRESAQKDETIEQSAKRLEQEAEFHRDQFSKMTPFQQAQIGVAKAKLEKDTGDTTVKDIVDGMERGDLPPTTTGLYGKGAAVRAEAARRGLNLTQLGLQYSSAQKQVAVLNGPQTTRLLGLSKSVDNTIDEVEALGEQLHNSGVPLLNHAKLVALTQTEGNSPRGQLATKYLTAVNTVKEEFANAANGGYAPTEPAWQLANQQINGDYGEQQLKASLGEVQRLIRYRVNAIPNINTLGPNAANKYTGNSGSAPQPQPAGRPQPSTKPPVVYQNGHQYNLQPDGSYQ